MKIILTGASGLIGSRFRELLASKHEIIPMSSKDCDITYSGSVENYFEFSEKNGIDLNNTDLLIHFAAKTNVDKCEEDKVSDQELLSKHWDGTGDITKSGVSEVDWVGELTALSINYFGTLNLYNAAKKRNIKFIYISTDFVFEGKGEYSEYSNLSPINWYGQTKYYGEQAIDVSKDLIVRLSFPYGYVSKVKNDFFWAIVDLLNFKDEVSLIGNQTITPTFIDDIVNGLDFLINKHARGIYHLTGSSYEVPLNIGNRIKQKMGLETIIKETTVEQLYSGKAARPFQSIMKNDKITQLGFSPKTFDQGLDLILK